jgi:hypothetical protein
MNIHSDALYLNKRFSTTKQVSGDGSQLFVVMAQDQPLSKRVLLILPLTATDTYLPQLQVMEQTYIQRMQQRILFFLLERFIIMYCWELLTRRDPNKHMRLLNKPEVADCLEEWARDLEMRSGRPPRLTWRDEDLNETSLGSAVLLAGYDIVSSESIDVNVEPDDQVSTWAIVENLDGAVLL